MSKDIKVDKKNRKRVEEEMKKYQQIVDECQSFIKPILERQGYHARIILYPGEPDPA